MKKIRLLLGTLLLFVLALSCGNNGEKNEDKSKGEENKKRVIKVGTDGVYAPFSFKDDNGKLTGYDVEVVQEIGKRLNVDIEFTTVPWDSIFLGLESKKYDMIANQIEKTSEREEKYIFSDKYLVSAAQIIVKEGVNNIKTLKDLEGKRMISAVGSNYSKTIEKYNETATKKINLDYSDDGITMTLVEIADGKADGALSDRLVVGYYKKQKGDKVQLVGEPLSVTPTHFVFRKDSEELKNEVDKALSEMKADGTLAKISEKWFGGDYTK